MVDSKENHKCWRNFPHQKTAATIISTQVPRSSSEPLPSSFSLPWCLAGQNASNHKDKKHKTRPNDCLENTAGWGCVQLSQLWLPNIDMFIHILSKHSVFPLRFGSSATMWTLSTLSANALPAFTCFFFFTVPHCSCSWFARSWQLWNCSIAWELQRVRLGVVQCRIYALTNPLLEIEMFRSYIFLVKRIMPQWCWQQRSGFASWEISHEVFFRSRMEMCDRKNSVYGVLVCLGVPTHHNGTSAPRMRCQQQRTGKSPGHQSSIQLKNWRLSYWEAILMAGSSCSRKGRLLHTRTTA